MRYDHERRVAVLSNGREYVPAAFRTEAVSILERIEEVASS